MKLEKLKQIEKFFKKVSNSLRISDFFNPPTLYRETSNQKLKQIEKIIHFYC